MIETIYKCDRCLKVLAKGDIQHDVSVLPSEFTVQDAGVDIVITQCGGDAMLQRRI